MFYAANSEIWIDFPLNLVETAFIMGKMAPVPDKVISRRFRPLKGAKYSAAV